MRPIPTRQHFTASQPIATHRRAATCAEVNCRHWLEGWVTLVDERSDFGKAQAAYIRHESRRHYVESRLEDGRAQFLFPAGQRCFRDHNVPLGKPPILTRTIDGIRAVYEPDQWTDTWNEEMFRLQKIIKRG